jgi:hypothetical protein
MHNLQYNHRKPIISPGNGDSGNSHILRNLKMLFWITRVQSLEKRLFWGGGKNCTEIYFLLKYEVHLELRFDQLQFFYISDILVKDTRGCRKY